MVLGLLVLAALPLYLVTAFVGEIASRIATLIDKRRRAKEAEQARLLQIRAVEARARYQLDQITMAARQAILDAANKKS